MGERQAACAVALGLAGIVGAGCADPLDPASCDMIAATAVVMSSDGTPMYPGQAIVAASCGGGGGVCHSDNARGERRFGTPAELAFDVSLAGDDAREFERLRIGSENLYRRRHAVWSAIESGGMPPADFADTPCGWPGVPSVTTAEGKSVIRNWLACGAPIVERTGSRPDGFPTIGAIVPRTEVMFQPTLASVHAGAICTGCLSSGCHSGEELGGELDLSTPDAMHESLVMRPAGGEACQGEGTLVVPGNPMTSLFYRKIADPRPPCGATMPLGRFFPPAAAEAIEAWIMAGAPR